MTHYVRLVFLGDYANARRAIREIRGDLTGLTASIRMIAMVGPAAVGAALAAIPLAFAGLGYWAVSKTEEVTRAFEKMTTHVLLKLRELAAGFIPIIVDMFGKAEQSFDRITPMLAAIFQKVAPYITQLGEAVLRFAETIMPAFHFAIMRSQPLIDALVSGIDALGKGFAMFIRNVAIATPSAALALHDFLNLLGELLPILGRIIAVLTEGFAPIIGELTFAIEGFGFAVLDFVKHLTAAAPAISTIFEAWISFWSGMLKILGPLVETLLNALAPIIVEVRRLLLYLADTIAQMLIPILAALGPPIAAVVGALADALRPALWAISFAFERMAPLLADVGRSLGELLVAAINALAPVLKPLVELALRLLDCFLRLIIPLAEIVTRLFPPFSELLQVIVNEGVIPLVDALLGMINDVMPFLIDIFGQVVNLMVTQMVPVLIEVARQLFPALLEVVRAVIPIVADLAKSVFPILVDVMKLLLPLFSDLVRMLLPLLVSIIKDLVVPIIRDLLAPVIRALAETVLPLLVKAMEGVIWVIREVLIPILKMIADVLRDYVIPFLRDYVIPFLRDTLVGAIKVVGDLIGKVFEGIKFGAEQAKKVFQEFLEWMQYLLVDLPKKFFDSGAKLMTSFADGINSQVDTARQAGIVAVDAASNPFPQSPAKIGPFSGQGYTLYRGQRLIEDFAKGIQDAAPSLAGIASRVLQGASVAISGFMGQGGTANANIPGVGAIQLQVAPGADSALASLLMNMVRTGQLQLQRVG